MKTLSAIELLDRVAKGEDFNVFVHGSDNYADEFDVDGYKYMSARELATNICSLAIIFEQPEYQPHWDSWMRYKEYEIYFGTNESLLFKSVQDFTATLKIYDLAGSYENAHEVVDFIETLFGKYGGGVTFFDRDFEEVFEIYEEETGIKNAYSEEETKAYQKWLLEKGTAAYKRAPIMELNQKIDMLTKALEEHTKGLAKELQKSDDAPHKESNIKHHENNIKSYEKQIAEAKLKLSTLEQK